MSQASADRRELAAGDVLGGYRLEKQVGEGGMGLVFRATREIDGAVVALKVTKLAFADDADYRRRFVHEARAATDVRHEGLVSVFEAGEAAGRAFIAVAYVPGPTLQETIEREGPLPVVRIVRLARTLAGALDALHARGIVHRDIKASNVLLADGAPLLTDFGLARGPEYTRLTKPGQILGSLEYMAPELIKGQPATPASDLYALGCVVYQCAAGRTPFGDRTLFEIGIAHLDQEPAEPGSARDEWPPALSEALLSALRKDPGGRPATAGDYAALLERAALPG